MPSGQDSGTRDSRQRTRKRLLFLTSRLPFHAPGGDSVRLMHMAQALASEYELTLLALSESKPNYAEIMKAEIDGPFSSVHTVYLPRWRSYLQTLMALPTRTPLQLAYYRSQRFGQMLKGLLPHHDGVVAHLQRTAQYVENSVQEKPVLLDMTDAISLNYQRVRDRGGKREWLHIVYALEQKRMERTERRAPSHFAETWLVSPVDIHYLFGDAAPNNVACMPVPVDLAEYPYQAKVSGRTVLFIGNLRSTQNRDACFWFCTEVLPHLRVQVPDLTFRVIGPVDAATRMQLQTHGGVEVRGEVDHIRDHLEDVFCGVCPVRMGAGMQNKVLNYLALGLPCVTSGVGLEGIEAVHGRDLFRFTTTSEAVEQILLLESSPAVRERVRAQGFSVARRYGAEEIYPRMRLRAASVFNQQLRAGEQEPAEAAIAEPFDMLPWIRAHTAMAATAEKEV